MSATTNGSAASTGDSDRSAASATSYSDLSAAASASDGNVYATTSASNGDFCASYRHVDTDSADCDLGAIDPYGNACSADFDGSSDVYGNVGSSDCCPDQHVGSSHCDPILFASQPC